MKQRPQREPGRRGFEQKSMNAFFRLLQWGHEQQEKKVSVSELYSKMGY